ncbi:MAG: catalase-peroxidase, partial [Halobacteriovoraceae bacterium]|nr:catalase-peroxidase [Halobacteriovoraceae bacterium]
MLRTKLPLMAILILALTGACATKSESSKSGNLFGKGMAKPASFWWPERLNLSPLRQHSAESNPYGRKYSYRKKFKQINYKALKSD